MTNFACEVGEAAPDQLKRAVTSELPFADHVERLLQSRGTGRAKKACFRQTADMQRPLDFNHAKHRHQVARHTNADVERTRSTDQVRWTRRAHGLTLDSSPAFVTRLGLRHGPLAGSDRCIPLQLTATRGVLDTLAGDLCTVLCTSVYRHRDRLHRLLLNTKAFDKPWRCSHMRRTILRRAKGEFPDIGR